MQKLVFLTFFLFHFSGNAQNSSSIAVKSNSSFGKVTVEQKSSDEISKSLKPKKKEKHQEQSQQKGVATSASTEKLNATTQTMLKKGGDTSLSKDEYNEQLSALDLISLSNPPLSKQIDIELKKAFIRLSMARDIGKNRKTAAEMTAEEKSHLEAGLVSINKVFDLAKNKKDKLASAYYLRGMIEFEYDLFLAMQKSLMQSLVEDPNSVQAPSIAIMIAEQFFDDEMYDDAVKYYTMLINKMTPMQKALANYKVAWCYLTQKKYDLAEDMLIRNFSIESKDQYLVDESIRDLAFTLTQHRNEDSIIEVVNSKIKSRQNKAKTLYLSLSFFHTQNPKDLKYKLVEEVLKVQDNKEERLKTIYYLIVGSRRAYASKDNINAEKRFYQEYKSLNIKPQDKAFTDISKQLEGESEYFIKTYIDTYADKVKNIENIPKEKLAEDTIFLIKYHNMMFPEAANKDLILTLWLDLCVDRKNDRCLLEVNQSLDLQVEALQKKYKTKDSVLSKNDNESNKKYMDLKERLDVELLVLYEEMFKSNPIELSKKYIEYLSKERVKEKEVVVLKKLLAIYLKSNSWVESEKYFNRLYVLEPTGENLYNLWLAQYNQKKCDLILNNPDKTKYNDKKMLDIQRECFLVQAKANSEKGNIQAYRESLKSFLSTNPDQEKKALVYLDYFSKIINAKDYKAASSEWDSLDPQIKQRVDFEPVRLSVILGLFDLGDIRSINKFCGPAQKDKEILFLSVQNELCFNPPNHTNVMKYWTQLELRQRNNFLSSLSLTQYTYLLNSFDRSNFRTTDEKRIWFMAKCLDQRSETPVLNEDEKRIFKEILPKSYFILDNSKLEQEYQAIKFPDKEPYAKYMKLVEGIINKVKSIRPKTLGELKKVSPAAAMSLVILASNIEQKVADIISNSPIPPEIKDEGQKNEYKAGLQGLAQEFVAQANEFRKLSDGIKGQVDKLQADKKSQELPEIDINRWPWPRNQAVQTAKDLFSQQSSFSALSYLERQWQLKKLSDDDYYLTRTGLLLTVQNSSVMRNYLRDELKYNKKEKIIEQWRSLK